LSLGGDVLMEFSDILMERVGLLSWLVVYMPPEVLWQ
jgi:hypothetical protein